VYSRFGFSDLIPALLSLNARVRLFRRGEMSLWDFMNAPLPAPLPAVQKDILVEIILPKEGRKTKVQMMRNSYTDYSLFCLAVSRRANDWIIAAGVCPGRAVLAEGTMARLRDSGEALPANAPAMAAGVAEELRFGDNGRASAAYRRELCVRFARRALEELGHEG
jgi:CO/xanthine dehydrogenase FAD-binding subunit